MTTAKNDIFIFFTGLNWLLWCERNRWGGLWWEGRGRKMSKFLAGGGYFTYSPSMENPIYIYIYMYIYIYIYILYIYIYKKNLANRMLHTMRLLRVHHIHHLPNRSSYFCKIWALCVSQNFITSGTCFLIPNDVRSISRSSLIKHH